MDIQFRHKVIIKSNYLEIFCDLPFKVPSICRYIATLHDDIYANTISFLQKW